MKFSLYFRHIGFQNGRHLKSAYAIIYGHNAAIDLILVFKCMFFGHGIQWYQFQLGIVKYLHVQLEFRILFTTSTFMMYLDTLTELAPWFHALDHNHYARWIPVHLKDMAELAT